jgi:hypothetical protein
MTWLFGNNNKDGRPAHAIDREEVTNILEYVTYRADDLETQATAARRDAKKYIRRLEQTDETQRTAKDCLKMSMQLVARAAQWRGIPDRIQQHYDNCKSWYLDGNEIIDDNELEAAFAGLTAEIDVEECVPASEEEDEMALLLAAYE